MKQVLLISFISFILCLSNAQYNSNALFAITEKNKDMIVSFNTKTKRYDTPKCISKKWCKDNCIQITLTEARKRSGIPYLTCQNEDISENTTITNHSNETKPVSKKEDQSAFDILSDNNNNALAILDSDWHGELLSPERVTFPISIKKESQEHIFSIDKHSFILKDLIINDNKNLSFSIKFNNSEDLKLSFRGTIFDNKITGNVIDTKNQKGTWQVTPGSAKKVSKRNSSPPVTYKSSPLTNQTLPSCLSVEFEEYPLKSSRLKGNFNGYTCNITSRCKDNIRILTADIPNGFSGSQAVKSTKGDARVSYYLWGGVGYLITKGRNNSASKESALFENKLHKGIITTGNIITTKTLIQKSEEPEINLIIKNLEDKQIYSINQ